MATSPSTDRPAGPEEGRVVVALEGIEKRFGDIQAVDGLTLSVTAGEIVGLVGPNGAGKTTAIRILLGLERPDAGTAAVLGEPMPEGRTQVADRIGYMPQHEALYPDLTVRETLEFFGGLQGLEDRAVRREAVASILDVVALADRADDLLTQLSGGMRRRVSLAAALVHRPRVAVLDEPTVGVDPELRYQMWQNLHNLADQGTAIIMSTHYIGEVDACDRVVFLRAGRLVADGSPDELRARAGAEDLETAFRRLAVETEDS